MMIPGQEDRGPMLHKTKGRLAAVFFRFVEHARLRRAAPLTPAAPRLPPGARGKGFPRRALRAPFGRPPASEIVAGNARNLCVSNEKVAKNGHFAHETQNLVAFSELT